MSIDVHMKMGMCVRVARSSMACPPSARAWQTVWLRYCCNTSTTGDLNRVLNPFTIMYNTLLID